jgi:ketosteroid isomerase-like protein
MTQPDENPIQAFNSAFSRGDMGALDQFFTENIVWHLTGTGPLAGSYQGVAQVMGLIGKMSELSGGTLQHELHDVLASNDHIVVLATVSAQRAGKQQLQDNVVHVIHGSGHGTATEIWTTHSDPAAQADFWS